MLCPTCKNNNPEHAKFCLYCGDKLLLICTECGAELPPFAKFCLQCGSAVDDKIADIPKSMAEDKLAKKIQRLIPVEYAELLHEAGGIVTPERRLVTILFSDVKGSTAMSEKLDPEEVLEIMNGAFDLLINPVFKYEGTLARLMGDAVLAFFGAPISHEDDAERAIRAGLEILTGARMYAEQIEAEHGISDFNVRIGINTGLVVVGEVGSDLRVEYTAIGDAINLAARMEQNAPPGGLLITQDTYRHVRGIFDINPQDPLTVKGKAEPIQTYLVERAKPRAFRVGNRGVEGVETQMVGREMELKILQDALYAAIEDGEGQIVTLIGDAGVGKSRLLYEFINWIELLPQKVRYYQGRALSDAQNQPYALLRDLFSRQFLIQDGDSIKNVIDHMETGFKEVFGDNEEAKMRAHIIAHLLGYDFRASPHVKGVLGDAQQLHDRALIYLEEYFQAISEIGPAVLFIEDGHWSDDSSLDMINHLIRKLPSWNILILCLARPSIYERRPHWGEGIEYHHRLNVKPLTKRSSRILVAEILKRVDDLPDELSNLVVEGAEGNPFYIEELIKMLLENGVIVKDQTRWRVELSILDDVDVPSTLTGVLQARLDSLPLDERLLLQQSSVIGRIFWDRVLWYINQLESDGFAIDEIDAKLIALNQRELIFRRELTTFLGSNEYIFKHTLLRDVTYESLLIRLRKVYHRRIAEWIIEQSPGGVEEFAGLVAEHYEHAGESRLAVDYYRCAGDQAVERYAFSEALQYYSQALVLVSGSDLNSVYNLLLRREKVFNFLGDRDQQLNDLMRLKDIAVKLVDKKLEAWAVLREIIYLEDIGDHQTALEKITPTLDLANSVGDVEALANLFFYRGRVFTYLEELEAALVPLEQALELARTHHLQKLTADVYKQLGIIQWIKFSLSKSKDYYQQALAIYREIGDLRGEGAVLNNLGIISISTNEIPSAKEYFERVLDIYRSIGFRRGLTVVFDNLSEIATIQGDYKLAIDLAIKTNELSREMNTRFQEQSSLYLIGRNYLEIGHYEQAKEYFDQAKDLIIPGQGSAYGQSYELLLNLYLMDYYHSLGYYMEAEDCYQHVCNHVDQLDSQERRSWLHMYMGLYKHKIGENRIALEHIANANSTFREHEDLENPLFGYILLGHVHTALGDLDKAQAEYDLALARRKNLIRQRWVYDLLAGMARLSLEYGHPAQSLSQVDEILTHLKTGNLDGTLEPIRVYLTCYQVLHANLDIRTAGILAGAYHMVMQRAENISDTKVRQSFLENVPMNREVIREYEKS